MKTWQRVGAIAVGILWLALWPGCDDEVLPPDDGNGGPADLGPFRDLDIFLRPYALQVPPNAGGLPTPVLADYYLTAFYQGGTVLASFDWVIPAGIGTIEPKAPGLTRTDATVILRPPFDTTLPIGFFDITAHGTSGAETASVTRRFAGVQNVWQKHQRAYFLANEPEHLVLWPTFLSSGPGAPATSDTIFYVETNTAAASRIRRIPAFGGLNQPETLPADTHLLPLLPDGNNYENSVKTQPDLSPPALGRREMIFSSQMDPDYAERCPAPGCRDIPPFRLWTARLPDGNSSFQPKNLTQDSTFIEFGDESWYATNYTQPRWDPKATNPAARIAFLSDLTPPGLWFADLLDVDGDAHSDTLVNHRSVTPGVAAFDWHPDGTRLCVIAAGGLNWVDAATKVVTPIEIPDDLPLLALAAPSVFWRPGEHTLIAFEAQAENLANIYVIDVEDNKITRVLPFPNPITTSTFPRWHPYRKELVYVSDYTVAAWANSTEGMQGRPDRAPLQAELLGMRRTLYPSPWVLRLE